MPASPHHPVTLVVVAKAPVAGRSKTRLCPPCTPEQAAEVAEAALADTLAVVAAAPAGRRVVALDGVPGAWLPAGIEVIGQRGDGLGERLAAAFADLADAGVGPLVLVGMDTPQLTVEHLLAASGRLADDGVDAVLGRAPDGGWWAIGLRHPDPRVFDGVEMSTEGTGAAQAARLDALGYRTVDLPMLRDVDRWDDALAAAADAPHGRFARTVARIDDEWQRADRAHADRRAIRRGAP